MTCRRYSNVRSPAWWFGVSLWLLGIFAAQPVSAQEKKTFVAFSMKVAQERVEEAVRKGQDFRTAQPDLFYLGGITRPWAVVIDSASGDWILLGERDPKASVLTLDDWVVALKARFIHPEEDPGVTIDPIPSDACRKAGKEKGCRDMTKQAVRFFGGIEDTHFGQVCHEADWLMKRIALALEQVPVQGLETYYDLAIKQARQAGNTSTLVSSRFWFYPIVSRVNVVGDVVLLEKMQMGVFTEVLYAEVNGQPVKDLDKFDHSPSEGFSRSFSEHYDKMAEAREVLETLRGLTLLAALAKGLTQVDARPSVTYFLQDYQLRKLSMPLEVEVLRTRNPDGRFQAAGGAQLMALAMRLQGGDVKSLRELVVRTRPMQQSLNWGFEVEVNEGQVSGVRLPPEISDPSPIGQMFVQAVFLHKKKYYDAAIEAYDKIIHLNPNWAEAYNNRGVIFLDKGLYDQTIAECDRALTINPNFAGAYNNRGLALAKKGFHDRAIVDYDRAISLNPYDADVYTNRAVSLKDKGLHDQALADFGRAITLNPNHVNAYVSRGNAFAAKGIYDRALADFDHALILNPNHLAAFYNRGRVLLDRGLYDQAIADFDRAITVDPHYADSYINRGITFSSKGMYDRALADFDHVLAENPNHVVAYYSRGVTFTKKGLPDRALADFDHTLFLDPNYASAYLARATTLQSQGLYDRAITDYSHALALNPKDVAAYYGRGMASVAKGLLDEAIADFDRALALNLDEAEVYNNRGIIFHRKGLYERAVTDYDHALALNPNYTPAYNNRGLTFSARGLQDRAIADFDRALTLDPNYADAYLNRGLAFSAKGLFDRALTDFDRAITLNPNDARSYNNRAVTWFFKNDYNRAWADVKRCRQAGGTPNPRFLELLQQASGRRE